MLIWRERLLSVAVMSLQTGGRLAVATEPIVDPKNLDVIAFYCEGPLVNFKPAILHTADIREFGELGLIVNDSENIMPLGDLVRLQGIIEHHFELIGKKVVDTTGHKLGKVNNYVVDTGSFKVMKFSVKRPLLHSLQDSELIIDRQQIRKITDDQIVVAAPTVEEKVKVSVLPRAHIQNPFRQAPAENADSSKT